MVICLERHVHRRTALALDDQIPAIGDCADTGSGSAATARRGFDRLALLWRRRERQFVVIATRERAAKFGFRALLPQDRTAWDCCPSDPGADVRLAENVSKVTDQAVRDVDACARDPTKRNGECDPRRRPVEPKRHLLRITGRQAHLVEPGLQSE